MKKYLLLLLLIPLMSFGQNIIIKRSLESSLGKEIALDDGNGNIKTVISFDTRVISDTLNITEIKGEFIQIQLGNRFHLLSTSEYKNVKMFRTYNQTKWNVFDGDKLIALKDEIDILDYFGKYGFELMKSGTKSTGGSSFTSYYPYPNSSFTSYFSRSKSVLTFRKIIKKD